MNMQETKDISPYKQSLKGKILESAMKAFGERGIRAVKMDDVASDLGISKRTLYEIYENKELLLFEGVKRYYKEREEYAERESHQCKNVMEIMLRIYRSKVEEFRQTNHLFYSDLVKYPSVLDFLEKQNQQMRNRSLKFMQRGIEEGFFRDDLNFELVSKMFDALGRYVMSNELYRTYTIEEIFNNMVFVSLRGMCTEKGIKVLDQML